jgi:hypothetical protein
MRHVVVVVVVVAVVVLLPPGLKIVKDNGKKDQVDLALSR